MTTIRSSTLTVLAACGAIITAGQGCACSVQIWGNSDSVSPDDYSRANPHHVHVGETTQFRILVEPAIASYVVLHVDDTPRLLPRVREGEYQFSMYIQPEWRGRDIRLQAHAYRQVGQRDFVTVNENELIRRAGDTDPRDEVLAGCGMTVDCYQSKTLFRVYAPGGEELDWTKAEIRIYRDAGGVTSVKLGGHGQPGFIVLGRDPGTNSYIVFYEPTYDQVRRAGHTRAVLTVPGPANRTIEREILVPTP